MQMSFSRGSRIGGVGVVAERLTPQTSDLEVWVSIDKKLCSLCLSQVYKLVPVISHWG